MDTKHEKNPSSHSAEESLFLRARKKKQQREDTVALMSDLDAPSSAEEDSPTTQRLFAQLGNYTPTSHGHGVVDLNAESKQILYQNIEAYQQDPRNQPTDKYRKQLIRLIDETVQTVQTNYHGSLEERSRQPETATTSMKALLSEEGMTLYKLALREEMYSKEYRDAVFNESTKYVYGPSWAKVPVIIISGPSGCGKSYATDMVVKQVDKLPKKTDGSEGNLLVSSDGGIGRQVSQMRKLVIRAANMKGYSGIDDLHRESKALDPIKDIVRETGLSDARFGIVMPETYSFWIDPRVRPKYQTFMRDISESDRQLIFGMVCGKNKDNFQAVVNYMGTMRAWKRDGFDDVVLDLNSTENLCESKAYGAGGFYFGKSGSEDAMQSYEKIEAAQKKPCLTIHIVNDLVLVKGAIVDCEPTWIAAQKGQAGIKMVSEIAYKRWSSLSSEQRASQGLIEYAKENHQSLVVPSRDFGLLVSTEEHRQRASVKSSLQGIKAGDATTDDPAFNP